VLTTTDGQEGGSGNPGVAAGIYYDSQNGLVHTLHYRYDRRGRVLKLRAFRASDLAQVYSADAINVAGAGCCGASGSLLSSAGMAGDASDTFFYAGASGSSVGVVRVVAGAAGCTSQTQERSIVLDGSGGIAVRVMGSGGGHAHYCRIGIPGKETFAVTGEPSVDRALTHIPISEGSLRDILRIVASIKGAAR